jgi:hypothetical protein
MDAAASGRLTLTIGGRATKPGATAGAAEAHDAFGPGADPSRGPSPAAQETRAGHDSALRDTPRNHPDADTGHPRTRNGTPAGQQAEHAADRAGDRPPGPDTRQPAGAQNAPSTRDAATNAAAAGAPAPVALPAQLPAPGAQPGAADAAARAVSGVGAKGAPGAPASAAGHGHLPASAARGEQPNAAPKPPAPASGPPPRPPAAFRAQLAQGLSSALRRGEGDVTLKLRPETLGELRVRVSVRGSSVDASIRASTIEAHRLLEQSVESLRAALQSRGLQVGRIELEPIAQDPRHDAGTAHHGAPQHDAGVGPGGEGREDGARDAAPERESGGGAARFDGTDPQDEGSADAWTPGASDAPGVVYSVADGAARVIMVDALA